MDVGEWGRGHGCFVASRIVVVVVVVMGHGHRITVVDTLWMHWTRCEHVGVVVDGSDLGSWWLWPSMVRVIVVVVVVVVATMVVVVVMGGVVVFICHCCWWAMGGSCQSYGRRTGTELTYDGDDSMRRHHLDDVAMPCRLPACSAVGADDVALPRCCHLIVRAVLVVGS